MVEVDREADLARVAAEEQRVREAQADRERAEAERRQAQGRIEKNR